MEILSGDIAGDGGLHAGLEITCCLAGTAVGQIPVRIVCVNCGRGNLEIELAGNRCLGTNPKGYFIINKEIALRPIHPLALTWDRLC